LDYFVLERILTNLYFSVITLCRFRFTELDPNDPSRQFAFLLDADLDEAYDIQECDPPLDPRTLEAISDRFNESDDMSEFIRGMRRAFQDTLEYRDNTVLL
jgi:hypothetical protein